MNWKLRATSFAGEVARALEAYATLGVHRFDIGVGRWTAVGEKGDFLYRPCDQNLTADRIRDHLLGWLRGENARGGDVYLRPHCRAAWATAFLDDLSAGAAEQIAATRRALILETSAGSYHAIIATDRALPTSGRHSIQKVLLYRLRENFPGGGGDPRSTAGDKFSRFPGFRNKKPERHGEIVRVVAMPRADLPPLPTEPVLTERYDSPRPLVPSSGGRAGSGAPFDAKVAKPRVGRHATGRDSTDSGKDWREVNIRLRRGDRPISVEAWLAGHVRGRLRRASAGEPERYARVTVVAACADNNIDYR